MFTGVAASRGGIERTGGRGRAELAVRVRAGRWLGGGRVDHAKALDARRWTEVVQAVLKRQAGVGSEFRVCSSLRMMTSPTFTTEPRVGMEWGRVI
jgi:hypothetical protein